MDYSFCGTFFRPKMWNSDTWQFVQVHYAKQSPKWSHLGKLSINPTWRIHLCSNLWGWKEDLLGYHSEKFQTLRIRNFGDTTKSISVIFAEEIGKLGLPVPRASLHCFQKRSTLDSSRWKGPYFYPIRSFKFQVLKIRVSLTNPRPNRSEPGQTPQIGKI